MEKAKKIRTIAIGIVALIIVSAVIFFVLKHRNSQEDVEEDDEDYDDDDYNEEKTIDLNEEEELFKRVNKAEFKPTEETNQTEQISQKTNQPEEDSNEIIENYFKNLEDKRKGKHF